MIEPPSPELWAQLRSRRPAYEEALETSVIAGVPGARPSMYAMDRRGELHLLLPVDGPPPDHRLADLRGLRVRQQELAGQGAYVDLVAGASHEEMFSPLCAAVLNCIVQQGRLPWDAVTSTVRAWQAAWKGAQSCMEKTVQVGLYGELLILEHIMLPALGPRAVLHWSGPDRERHDFVGERMHLEVKTTRRRRHEHEISRVDQLHAPEGRTLYLASVILEESAAGAGTLATRIDAVSQLLGTAPAESDEFQAKLVQLGWSDEMRRTGELMRFHHSDSIILTVDDGFPRLPPGFVLPAGVVALRYTVDLANLPVLDKEEVVEAVTRGFPPLAA
jgi:hypothetical protein